MDCARVYRRHRGFGFARVHNDNFRIVFVAHDALPHDWMSNTTLSKPVQRGELLAVIAKLLEPSQ
jgi:hypothetical protein